MQGKRTNIWQYHAPQVNGDGFKYLYSECPSGDPGWIRDGVAFQAYSRGNFFIQGGAQIYEYHVVEKNGEGWAFTYSLEPALQGDWISDGIAWWAYIDSVPGTRPIYQYRSDLADSRVRFSVDSNLGDGWILDKIAFYCF